jgi:hypothetical protein
MLKDPISGEELYSANYTHNIAPMAQAAGIYEALWHPREGGFQTAEMLLPILQIGLRELVKDPDFYKQYNPSNGWGDYDSFVKFVEGIVIACIEHPDAIPDADI